MHPRAIIYAGQLKCSSKTFTLQLLGQENTTGTVFQGFCNAVGSAHFNWKTISWRAHSEMLFANCRSDCLAFDRAAACLPSSTTPYTRMCTADKRRFRIHKITCPESWPAVAALLLCCRPQCAAVIYLLSPTHTHT